MDVNPRSETYGEVNRDGGAIHNHAGLVVVEHCKFGGNFGVKVAAASTQPSPPSHSHLGTTPHFSVCICC